MIDFRYHLVSIVAVFLALAIGLLLGSTNKVREYSDKLLEKEIASIQQTNDKLRADVGTQTDKLASDNQFAQVLAPQIVAGRLRGESVVFVQAPHVSDSVRTGLDTVVKSAGGSVSGWVTLSDKFLADDQLAFVDQLAATVKPPATVFPEDADGYAKAAQVLAPLLVTKDVARAGHEEVTFGSVFDAFHDGGLLTTGGKPGARATLAILIAPDEPVDGKLAEGDNKALISLAAALDANARGTVVVGNSSSAEANGLLNALRSSNAGSSVSSVDTANTASGQIVTVLALDDEIDGKSGKYGTGDGVSGALPVPVPSLGARQ